MDASPTRASSYTIKLREVGEVPQRQGDDLGRRGRRRSGAGAGSPRWASDSGSTSRRRGQGSLHRRDQHEAALELAPLRPRRSRNAAHLPEGESSRRRGRASSRSSSAPAPSASSSTSPTGTSSWPASRTTAPAPMRPTASGASAPPTSTRSSSSPCPTSRCGWPGSRPASTTTRCSVKQDSYERIKSLPGSGVAHRQAARLGGRGHEPQVRR